MRRASRTFRQTRETTVVSQAPRLSTLLVSARLALALAEHVARLADRPDPVPDAVLDEAARHYDEAGLAALLLEIALANVFNRVNVSIRQPAGVWG